MLNDADVSYLKEEIHATMKRIKDTKKKKDEKNNVNF